MSTPLEVLKKYWGYPAFRPLQEDIINSALAKKDTLALLPTGGGKSICFQVPAMCQQGICIVISPLIALMKDQVYHLKQKGIKAIAIYSGMSKREIDIALDNCIYGNIKFLYVSPERLKTDIFIERVKQMNVNLWAVDEAHCISQWGYDFRPPYLQIAGIRQFHPTVPVLALTATATPKVVVDIQEKLVFKENNVFQKSFSRSNLSYSVLYEDAKLTKLVDILQKVKGTSVVYVRNRRKTKEIADYLKQCKISATYYHAGLKSEERARKQEDWIQGKVRVMVSTNAFGMGIDKADVRTVVHMDLPDSPEAYFQEAGRAGRDEKKAYAVLLFNNADKHEAIEKLEETMPTIPEIKKVYNALGNFFQIAEGAGIDMVFDFNITTFSKRYNFSVLKIYQSLKFLEQEEYLYLSEGIYQSSKLMVLYNKQELYKFMLDNLELEPIMKYILRVYGGVFDGYVKIKERQLAQHLNSNVKDIIKTLQILDRVGVIAYEKYKDEPFIQFLKPRLSEQNLYLNVEQIKERIKVFKDKLNAMISYATETTSCRSKVLLAYFGENKSENCGVCDVCLGRNEKEVDEKEYQEISILVKKYIKDQALSLNQINKKIPYQNKEKLNRVLKMLLDYNFLQKQENDTYSWNNKA
ncbi:MAG: RecQ family ATP-dependent DNA helicase [Chitinophagales bacterium]|nr:RecQ family ATP-dependent DNA helicase [Chitinophagales bacterium]